MKYQVRLVTAAEADIESAFNWYQSERFGLGLEFLAEMYAAFDSLEENPLKYQIQKSDIRRMLVRRFPYALYYLVENDLVTIIAVLHAARNPKSWQRRPGHWVSESE